MKRGGISGFRAAANKVVKAMDPVSSKMVSTVDLKLATHEEARSYIKKYNTISPVEAKVDKDENGKDIMSVLEDN